MKCINRYHWKQVCILFSICVMCLLFTGCAEQEEIEVTSYEIENYNTSLYRGTLFASDLCVSAESNTTDDLLTTSSVSGAALFDLDHQEILYGENLHSNVYPASTTKIMTALLAIEYGSLDETVTVSATASSETFSYGESVIELKEGDQVTLRDLLYGLMLNSGNDAARAIGEHISGTEEAFCELMNQKAKELMATHTHFTNTHGLHDDDHYTTTYDLYLIFREALKHDEFVEIIKASSYTMNLTASDGNAKTIECEPTNLYALGEADQPSKATVIGGKTGTTSQAGYCLVAYAEANSGGGYITIVMGAQTKPLLYQNMTAVIDSINAD